MNLTRPLNGARHEEPAQCRDCTRWVPVLASARTCDFGQRARLQQANSLARSLPTRPAVPFPRTSTWNETATRGAGIDVLERSTPWGDEHGPDLFQRHPNQIRHTMSDSVVAMPGVTAEIPVESIAHVDQFFSHDDFNCSRTSPVDPPKVNQHTVPVGPRVECISAANPCRYRGSPNPAAKHPTIRGYLQGIRGQGEALHVLDHQRLNIGGALPQDHTLPNPSRGPGIGPRTIR